MTEKPTKDFFFPVREIADRNVNSYNLPIERKGSSQLRDIYTGQTDATCAKILETQSESCTTTKGVINSNSDDEFLSACEGSDSEDGFIPLLCDDNNIKKEDPDDGYIAKTREEGESNKQMTILKEADEFEVIKQQEGSLTGKEIEDRRAKSQLLKDEGNMKFCNANYDDAIGSYTEALSICPSSCLKERSVMYSNRAACKVKKELYDGAIEDCSSALELHPHYMKALLRRAELYEKTEKLDEALKDYQQLVEIDSSQHMARAACVKLSEQIKDRNEKMKEEMMGKLKELGNLVLRPFGLSTNNFQMQQDPNTGSYSVQFNQNPNNGS